MSHLAFDRAGPPEAPTVLLVHAGVADRRMWDPVWDGLTSSYDTIRMDLRGYGASTVPPDGSLAPHLDVVALLDHLGVVSAYLIGASYGAGVAVDVTLSHPDRVTSLFLNTPGGALIPEVTGQLREFIAAEDAALETGDLDAAVEANLATWVDGPGQRADRVDPVVRESVATMQRRAFEISADWADLDEIELDTLGRLPEVSVPTLVLSGALDVDAIRLAADTVVARVPRATQVTWSDVAHLPVLERPARWEELALGWLSARRS